MSEIHFKAESITRITLRKRKPSEYYWAPSRPVNVEHFEWKEECAGVLSKTND